MQKGRRQVKKLEMEQKIYDAAIDLFIEKGYKNTTVQEIADRAEVSKRSVSYYFPLKEDFVLKFGLGQTSLLEQFAQDIPEELDAKQKIIAVLGEAVKGAIDAPKYAKFQMLEVYHSDMLYELEVKNRQQLGSIFSNILCQEQNRGGLSLEVDCNHIGGMIVAIYFNALFIYFSSDYKLDLYNHVLKSINILFKGIGFIK